MNDSMINLTLLKSQTEQLWNEMEEKIRMIEKSPIYSQTENTSLSYDKLSETSVCIEKCFQGTFDFEEFTKKEIYDYYIYHSKKQGFCVYNALSHSIFANQIRWIFRMQDFCLISSLQELNDIQHIMICILSKWIQFYVYLVCCTELELGKEIFFDQGIVHPSIPSLKDEWDDSRGVPSLWIVIRKLVLYFSAIVEEEIKFAKNPSETKKMTPFIQHLKSLFIIPWDLSFPIRKNPPPDSVQIKVPSFSFQKMFKTYVLSKLLPSSPWESFVLQMKQQSYDFENEMIILLALFSYCKQTPIPFQICFLVPQPYKKADFTGQYMKLYKEDQILNKESIFQSCCVLFSENKYFSLLHRKVLYGSMDQTGIIQWLYPHASIPIDKIKMFYQRIQPLLNEFVKPMSPAVNPNVAIQGSIPIVSFNPIEAPIVRSTKEEHLVSSFSQEDQKNHPHVVDVSLIQTPKPVSSSVFDQMSLEKQIRKFAEENLTISVFVYQDQSFQNTQIMFGIKTGENDILIQIVDFQGKTFTIPKSLLISEKSYRIVIK